MLYQFMKGYDKEREEQPDKESPRVRSGRSLAKELLCPCSWGAKEIDLITVNAMQQSPAELPRLTKGGLGLSLTFSLLPSVKTQRAPKQKRILFVFVHQSGLAFGPVILPLPSFLLREPWKSTRETEGRRDHKRPAPSERESNGNLGLNLSVREPEVGKI